MVVSSIHTEPEFDYNYLEYLNRVNHMEIERIKGIPALINETVIVMESKGRLEY